MSFYPESTKASTVFRSPTSAAGSSEPQNYSNLVATANIKASATMRPQTESVNSTEIRKNPLILKGVPSMLSNIGS
jgi:hypothetical protein